MSLLGSAVVGPPKLHLSNFLLALWLGATASWLVTVFVRGCGVHVCSGCGYGSALFSVRFALCVSCLRFGFHVASLRHGCVASLGFWVP